jgi:hypothetical protein
MSAELTENDKQIIQPSTISLPLMSHQKTIIHKMLEMEDLDEYDIKYNPNYYSKDTYDAKLRTNIGVLADKVGAGKTLSVISLISIRPILKDKLTNLGSTKYMGLQVEYLNAKLNTNLIVVPHKLVPQWKTSFEKATNLKVYAIATNSQIDKIVTTKIIKQKNWQDEDIEIHKTELDFEKVSKYNVIIVGDTMYKRFYSCSDIYKWNRIFIDEADTIKLPRDMECYFNFLWLITGTPKGLANKSKPFIGKIFYDNDLGLTKYITLKNDNKYIEQSIVLPHPKRIQIRCLTPKELSIIKDLIPPSVLQMINAGNSEEAIKALNCNVDTNENILQVITKNIVDSIANKEIELDAEKKKHYPIAQQKDQEHKIKIIENSLKKLQEKYEDIKKKIYELNNDYCPVCMSSFINPVIVNCCKNCFCFDCLAVSMGELKNNICPFCRQGICKSDIHLISDNDDLKTNITKITKKHDLKDKLDVLTDLIEKKPDGSFMIFANYAETFSKIEKKLKDLNITYHILKGQSGTVAKYIDEFKDKKVRVLMLNAQYFGAGMNLQMTTDLVIYHRFTKEMEEQIIGRAQRLGRTTPLNVYYLIHENESSNIEDKFNFEDVKDIHYLDWIEQQENEKNKKTEHNTTIYNDAQVIVDSYSNELGEINDKINSIPQSKFGDNDYIVVSGKKIKHVDDELSDIEYSSEDDKITIKRKSHIIKSSKNLKNTTIYDSSDSSDDDNIDFNDFAIVK